MCNDDRMRRRLLVLLALGSAILAGAAAIPAPASASGKTGVYKDSCGNNHVWVLGRDLTPIENVWCGPPPE